LFISALTLGEINKGIEKLPDGSRRAGIAVWLEVELPAWFEYRVLLVDAAVAAEWGRLTARVGSALPAIDSLIAATALRHRLTIVTRNISEFVRTGVDLVDPWRAA
jgi:predicted nucleic acid-binding protein